MATLTTERLTLRPLVQADAPQLHRVWSDADALEHWHRPPSKSVEESASILAAMRTREAALEWAICLRDAPARDALIGHVGFLTAHPGRRCPFGYILRRDVWGRGFATEAARAALRHGFEAAGVSGAELWIYAGNRGSVRVAEKLGARLRGQFRAFNAARGALFETWVYGITAAEAGVAQTPSPATPVYDVQPVIVTTDVARAVAFYCGRLGFTLDWAAGDPPVAASVSRGDWTPQRATLRFVRVAEAPACRPGWLAFNVHDVDALHREFVAAEVSVEAPPESMPWGFREMEVVDRDGQRLRFASPG